MSTSNDKVQFVAPISSIVQVPNMPDVAELPSVDMGSDFCFKWLYALTNAV